ncbi:MAG: hypothetical protein ACLR5N_04065 [Haemophilus parainfluenzae]
MGSPPNAIATSQLHLGFADWLMYGTPVMLILFPLIIGWLYIVFKPKLGLRFAAEFEKIHMTKQRVLTLGYFCITVAILWIFGGYINPILSQLLGLPKPIGSFDSMVALSAAIVICVAGIASWKEVQRRKYRMGRVIPLRWRLNLKFCTHPFRCRVKSWQMV